MPGSPSRKARKPADHSREPAFRDLGLERSEVLGPLQQLQTLSQFEATSRRGEHRRLPNGTRLELWTDGTTALDFGGGLALWASSRDAHRVLALAQLLIDSGQEV